MRRTVLQADIYRELADKLENNKNFAIPTPLSDDSLEALFTDIASRQI